MPKVPRYSAFQPSSPLSSEIKKRNLARDSRAEMLLRRELWKRGLRYRLHDASLPGKPDIILSRAKLVVFCDGDFWHGRNWRSLKAKLAGGANAGYWIPKIKANLLRDRRITRDLEKMGWTVLRFWETDVLADCDTAAALTFRTAKRKTKR